MRVLYSLLLTRKLGEEKGHASLPSRCWEAGQPLGISVHTGRGSFPRDLSSSLSWVSCLRKKSCVLSRLLLEPKHTEHNPSRAAMLDWAGGPGTYLLTILSSACCPCAPQALAEFANPCRVPLFEVQGLRVCWDSLACRQRSMEEGRCPGVVQPVSAISASASCLNAFGEALACTVRNPGAHVFQQVEAPYSGVWMQALMGL